MGPGTLEDEARALYTVPPAAFVAARNARRGELRGDDRELADAVGELRRASPAAWLTTALVRDHPEVLVELEELAGRLRGAVDAADREALASLAEERRETLRQATELASEVAEDEGVTAGRAALDAVSATLQAAMGDAAAASAVRSGLLLRALQGSGFDPVDLTDALALEGAIAGVDVEPPKPRPRLRRVQDPDAELARARQEAEEAVAEAEAEARRASDAALDLEQRIVDTDQIRAELEQELDDLQVELARTRDGLTSARRELRELETERARATRARDRADDALERARERRARFS